MAGPVMTVERVTPRYPLTLLTALGCALAGYVFLGAPGLAQTSVGAWVPAFDPASGWFPAMHLFATGAILAGGAAVSRLLSRLDRPGLLPLTLFAIFQFGLLAVALTNMAIAAGAVRMGGGDAWVGALYLLPAIIALRLHPDLYMSVLKFRSWTHSMSLSALGPLKGGVLVALTVAANLAPLSLTFQFMTTHAGAQLAALFRRAVIAPDWYLRTLSEQITTVTATEWFLILCALGLSAFLGAIWSAGRVSTLRQAAMVRGLATQLSEAQHRFVADAVPAAVSAVMARASKARFLGWAFFWSFVIAPVCLAAAYFTYQWFDVLQAQHALSWVTTQASDFTPFAAGEAGWAEIAIPAALGLFVLLMSGPFARMVFAGARYDQLAYGSMLEETLQSRLLAGVAKGDFGPGQSFDADAFVAQASRRRYWISVPLVLAAIATAAATGFRDAGRGVAFTGDGLIAQDHFFSPPRLVRYYEVQAVAIDCKIGPAGGRPVYELTLPGGRVVDMIGSAPLNLMLDRYIATDQRLQFSGVGYAYPPGDLEPCLKAIQQQYNSVIAAGAARLLHVLD
jgi:hypothetical protein